MPRNARTDRRYRGLNVLALWCAAQAHGYPDARWCCSTRNYPAASAPG
ncbi:ArdC-like ssDNA-binding domain-containing protein [Methylobacterium frigidaeris]|nr:ArdC family protein [Methylobacterium frigidaeris]PIK71079.1 hypothetical protein CS379_21235 [Methylobacterium frigidaeris]